ncbi:protein-L-isoaspartate O-methyltransferase [Microvirga aerilata]|uniref:Protein-L-isoaspartate O-methyltransferase n=1 Tax=Microvirga aerilata TaxID=670292 RepID=A0A937D532_9HYPH|nr:protein-L-isoaspartate O-methyltransferase [Microvirga aerilata]
MKPMTETHLAILRRHMVELIALQADLMSEEIGKSSLDERVLAAMRRVQRHLFVPPQLAAIAYQDTPLPIGFNKTVSQPFICALMTDLLDLHPQETVLEIGTGLGYQAAVLAEIARQVWTVEVVEEFASHAESRSERFMSFDKALRSCGS